MASWRTGRRRDRLAASKLYGAIVSAAREPAHYQAMGAPDTIEGRFGVLVLHVAAVIDRLARLGIEGERLAQHVTEAFVTDIDDNLREIGVGDLSVPRKVRKAAAALLERGQAYRQALRVGDRDALATLIGEHVVGRAEPAAGRALANRLQALAAALERSSTEHLLAGDLKLPEATGSEAD
jgi:cytochrome b pre-mRNA-processing protein 3